MTAFATSQPSFAAWAQLPHCPCPAQCPRLHHTALLLPSPALGALINLSMPEGRVPAAPEEVNGQGVPWVTESSEPQGDVGYRFIMTKARSHVSFKVHYNSPSTNHRHKPGIVQIRPRWQRTLSGQWGWDELWDGGRRGAEGEGVGLGYKCCSTQTQTLKTGLRAGRAGPRLCWGRLSSWHRPRALCTGRRAMGMGHALHGSLTLPRAAGQQAPSWANTVLQHCSRLAPLSPKPQPAPECQKHPQSFPFVYTHSRYECCALLKPHHCNIQAILCNKKGSQPERTHSAGS